MPDSSRARRARLPVDRTTVEYLVLADAVEALGGKLYMMGGGWDTMHVRNIEQPVPMSIACGILVPWAETDDDHTLTITTEDQDRNQVAPPLTVTFKTGRSANLERGAPTHVPFAIKAEFVLPTLGTYVIRATVDARPEGGRSTAFSVRQATGATSVGT
jgi:hypothetical protein